MDTSEPSRFPPGDGEMARLIRAYDWSRTPLGPPSAWSASLRNVVGFMLANRFPHLLWWGPDYIQLYNDHYIPVLGAKHPGEALGKPFRECWHEVYDTLGPLVDVPFRGGPATWMDDIELIVRRRGFPEESHFMFSYSAVPDESVAGGIGGVIATVHEITEKVITERRVRILSELAAGVADAKTDAQACAQAIDVLARHPKDVPFAIAYLLDGDRSVLKRASATGLAPGSFAPDAIALDPVESEWPFARALETEQPQLHDGLAAMRVVPPGPWQDPPGALVVVPIKSHLAGRPVGVLVIGVSSSIRYDARYSGFLELLASQVATGIANARAYEEERSRAEALAEIDRAKTAFFSNVSHEFRTPLTLMLGPLDDALAPGAAPASVRGHVETAQRNAQRLLKLVNALLDFSRIEAGRLQAAFAPTDLAALTADLASTFRSAMQRAGLGFDVDVSLDRAVHVDRDMWEKIVLNLLSNAFKFTLAGSIRLRLSRDGETAVLEVADTGGGIPEAEIPRLFERFHRVEGAVARTHEGSGIGLALVQELVRLHGGTISVASRLGAGTRFVVRIPIGTAHLPADRIVSPAAGEGGLVERGFVQEALRWLPDAGPHDAGAHVASARHADARFASTFGARVLLADDNQDMRHYVRDLLQPSYVVTTAADGIAALEAAREDAPDLVIADVMMPRLDGVGLLQALRADPRLRDTPVILLSARAGEEARIDGLAAGADDYVVKPFHARELLARVGALLELTALRRETEDRYRAFVQASTDVVYRMSPDWSEMRRLEGRDFIADQAEPNRNWLEKYLLPEDRATVLAEIAAAIATKRPFELEHRVIRADGSTGWTLSRAVPLLDASGDVTEWFGTAADVTARRTKQDELRAADAAVREERRSLEILNRAGAALATEDDLHKLVQLVTDAGVELTGAQFGAFFYNVEDEQRGRYTLYTLSGAPPEAFAKFPMPRNTDVFAPTFSGQGIVRSDDITKDPRYGRNAPRRGMPEGHLPVHSYLAVPVISRDGSVLGGLFFGHERVGVFTERSERGLTGLAAQAAVAIDNVNLAQATQREIAERTRAQAALHDLNANLEREISARTEQLRVNEEALRQAQKMEAVGQLTGGVAHDFNNLLQVIVGNLELIRRMVPGDATRIQRSVEMALNSSRQAASLTQRLLAFSRRQPLDPKPVDLNSLVGAMSDLLSRSLGETIALETRRGAGLWKVEVDPNALEAAILNLAVNSRDAMPAGGRLTIETANVRIATGRNDAPPGDYVSLVVGDSGDGMDAETLARAFEPFFTTKPVGKGTGLGLSQVYGFVKQSGGFVEIDSQRGHGTRVHIFLRRFEGAVTADEIPADRDLASGTQGESVLVVEDDDSVRSYTVDALRELGYRVIEAPDGPSAVELLEGPAPIDLLLSDVVLPNGMTGAQVAEAARARRPGIRVLFATGYARDAIVHDGRLDKGVQLITKPFSFADLAARVREVLDGGA